MGTKHGLNRIQGGKITRYFRPEGLASECIHTLMVDAAGVLWVGTVGGGLAIARGERFVSIGVEQGLENGVIGQILDDGRGSIWLGSNGGIMRVRRKELLACADGRLAKVRCEVFNRHDGMLNPECAGSFQPAGFKAHDGRLWFATVGGVVMIDPKCLATNAAPPLVHVESVAADGVACALSPSQPDRPHATIPAGTTRVEITYTGISFAAPENIKFQCRVDGWDKDWIDTGSRRIASLGRLPPGQYDFRVRASNSDGAWNEEGGRLKLCLAAFWWQTTWFRWLMLGGVTITGSAGISLAHRRRLRQALAAAERRNAELRAAELGSANRILQARTAELEAALANIKTLHGLIPICAGCKRIRDDHGFWEQVELYVTKHSDAKFSHGLCPPCARKYFGDLADDDSPQPPAAS